VLKYGDRPFTPWRGSYRNPEALMLYLSLIFYPAPTRLSITHDFEVSAALFRPWTTLPSLGRCGWADWLAMWRIRRWPPREFRHSFLFLNHASRSGIVAWSWYSNIAITCPPCSFFCPCGSIARAMIISAPGVAW